MKSFLLLLILIHFAAAQIIPPPLPLSPIVNTETGQVQGHRVTLNSSQVVYSFWAIPFAQAPERELRFELPRKAAPWEGVKQVTELGAACPQGLGFIAATHPLWNQFSEDCLHLNVFTPDLNGNNPVMVWFYGGGYISGTNIQYPGHFLAARGVVLVAVNYRVGHFGFLTTEDTVVPGNAALFDQKMGLEWVRDNIRNFGGNPNMVTIFGQSAGASSAALHMISPQSTGLFHQAILESGTDSSFWAINWPEQIPAEYTFQVADKVGCYNINTQTMVNCLREIPWQQLYNVSFTCAEGHFCQGMAPVIDGLNGFIPDHPFTLRETGQYNIVPTLAGHNTEDGSLYTLFFIPESSSGGFNRSMFEYYLEHNLLDIWNPQFPMDVQTDMFEAINWHYSPWPHIDDEEGNRQAFNHIITDAAFGASNDAVMKSQSVNSTTYSYVFGYRSSNLTRIVPEWMGVPHIAEIPYVFGYPLLQLNPEVRQDCRIVDIIDWNDEDIDYTNYFQPMITNFAIHGNPTPEPVSPPTGEEPFTWPTFEGAMRENLNLNYLYVHNDVNEIRQDYRQKEFAFLSSYISYITGKKFTPDNTPIPPSKTSRHSRRSRGKKVGGSNRRLESNWLQKELENFLAEIDWEETDIE